MASQQEITHIAQLEHEFFNDMDIIPDAPNLSS
jgi:hypothetical protein